MNNADKTSKCPRRLLAVCALLLGWGVIAGACGKRGRRTPSDTLVMVLETTLRDVDPRFAITNYDVKLSRLIAPGLTTVDSQDLEPRLHVAESIEQVDDTHWRVRIRPDLLFSDGTPLRASDVAFTYNSVLAKETKSLYRKSFSERLTAVRALDERDLEFTLHSPIATLLSDLDFGILSEAAARDGRVVGVGPFALSSFAPEKVVLVRNEQYRLGPVARMPRIEVRTVRDGNARNLMLVGGSADISQNSVRVDLVDFIEKRERVQVQSGESAILTYLMMHNEDPLLSDVRVRKAIAYAIDRRRIVEAKYGGRASLATGLLPLFHWAYERDVPTYEFDPVRAGELLDEAGYPDPDGPGGKPRFRLSYKTSASQFRLAVARVIASQLSEVGIAVDVQSFEFGTFFADVKKGNYQLASMQTSAISEPDFHYTYFHSSRIPDPENLHVHNRWRYRSDSLDRLVERGRVTMQRDERKSIYADVQRIVAEDLPIVPLWHEHNIVVMNRSLSGYTLLPSARLAGFANVVKTREGE
ncbi:MAG: ABC transporter substrate-binding protein [Myxococcales bacterium]|nr:ABC transporter substrate-binding protein [Myxococcales bacterium]